MANRDDLLQHYIAMLEAGASLEEVMSRLPENEAHLRSLLQLTAAIRAAPRPEPSTAFNRNNVVYDFLQTQAHKRRRPFLPDLRRAWDAPRLALSGLAVAALVVLAVVWFVALGSQIQPANALVLAEARGQIEGTTPDGVAWQPLHAGAPLAAGQRLRSGPGATAVLHFADGSRLHLAADSELSIVTLEQPQPETLVVELLQRVGYTRHQVTPLRSADAVYVIDTPSGRAEVRGTTFSVDVAADGHAYFAVDEGAVTVTADDTAVAIAAGFTTGTQTGRAPAPPVRYFRSQGELLRLEPTLWQIDEMLIYVTEETILSGAFTIGDLVQASGRILPNGRWQADSIRAAIDAERQAAFAGPLQAMTPHLWLVDGVSVTVTEATQRPSDLSINDLVRVVYTHDGDGRRLALQIELLEPAANANQPARPSLAFEPDELEASGCETSYVLIGLLANSGEPPQDAAAGVELGYTLLTGAQFVNGVSIDPPGWATIAAGESVAFSVQVDLSAAWLAAQPETEVKLRLYIAAETNRPGQHPTQLTITLVQTCDPSTRIPTATPTPRQPATPPPTPSPTPGGDDCTGVSPHPEALRLARIYGVLYAEIMGWFCEGFGFGEIDLAYGLSQDTGTAVADIFAMRRQGLGWGEIMQALGLLPAPPLTPPAGPPATPPAPSVTPPGPPATLPAPSVTPPGPPATLPGPPTGLPPGPTNTPGAPPTDAPPDPSATPEPDDGPPIVPPAPSMTPPGPPATLPGPPATPPGGRP
jgi:ferric-dicitrate binding protein FerR (iron transport regulator)